MAENKIEIQIDAGIQNFSRAINQADKATAKLTGNVVDGMKDASKAVSKLSQEVSGGLGGAIGKIAGGVAIGNLISKGVESAISTVKKFATESIVAFQQQEDAVNKLTFAMKASGDFTDTALSSFKKFASNLQETSIYGDETTLAMLALAKSFGASNDQAMKLVQGAADLASTFGGSLEERVDQLGKTLSGTSGRLGQLIPEMKNLTEAQLRAGDAIDIVSNKFKGSAANAVNSYSGTIAQLKNSYSDLQEEFGSFIANNKLIRDAIDVTKTAMKGYTQSVIDSRIEEQRRSGTLTETEDSLDQLKRKMDELKVQRIDAEQIIVNPSLFDKFLARPTQAAANVKRLSKEIEALEQVYNKAKLGVDQKNREDLEAQKKNQANKPPQAMTDTDLRLIADQKALIEQRKQMMLEFDVFQENLVIERSNRELEFNQEAYERLIDFENEKIQVILNAELEKAKTIRDAGLRRETEENARQKASLDRMKNEQSVSKRMSEDRIKLERQEAQYKLQIASNFIQSGMMIAKEGTAAQKALMIAQATMNTYTGATNALRDYPAWIAPAMAASMIALGLANVARIAGAKFETGGIVGGNHYNGDKVGVRVNSGEMILTREQQKTLFEDINQRRVGGGSQDMSQIMEAIRSMPIVVHASGREIARLVRDERSSGFGV
jgi:hypothetical protein